MRTYYSPYRWWLVGAFVIVPLASFANNALKHAIDLMGAVMYLGGGALFCYIAYRVAMGMKVVPSLVIESGVLSYQRFQKDETSFELANLERVERNAKGVWQAVLREPIVTGDGLETNTVLFPDFTGWRKGNWRTALGADANIVV